MPPPRAGKGREPDIERHASAKQLDELWREHSRLLREIEKKRQLTNAARAEALRLSSEALARMKPIVERQRALEAALEALFDELLRDGRLAPRARKEVARLRALLELHGVLPRLGLDEQDEDDDGEEGQGADAPHDRANPWDAPPRHARRSPKGSASTAPEVPGASQTGQDRRTLRDLFRKLATLVHPDRARQEGDRQRRTEVMKQVTRAYEDGDLARLLELEGAWQSETRLHDADPERRIRELERVNRELLAQLRAVNAELRDSKRALREAREALPDDVTVARATRELEQVEAVGEMLQRFRDGKLSSSDLTQAWAGSGRRGRRGG